MSSVTGKAAADRGLQPVRRHRWNLTPKQAIALQQRMRPRLVIRGGPRAPRLIAGADVAYDKGLGRCFAAVVMMELPELDLVEQATAEGETNFPYVPGLLTFREGPVLLAALSRLERRPDLIMFDGQGLAHPRRFGLASHIGYLLDIPSIGCAKSILVGNHAKVGRQRGSFAWLVHRGERVGAALRTQTGIRLVYVSPGHRIGFQAAIRVVLTTARKFRLPEPTRIADIAVADLKNRYLRAGHPAGHR